MWILAGPLLFGSAAACAQESPAVETQPTTAELLAELRLLREQMRQQQERHDAELKALQTQIDELKEKTPGSAPTTTPATQPAVTSEQELEGLLSGVTTTPTTQAAVPTGPLFSLRGPGQSFNPDISLNADFLGAFSTREGGTLDDEFLFRELEVSFSGAVDPYTRTDFFVTIERENDEFHVDLEEGYLAFVTLPYDLQARLGKFRAGFGRANTMHRHALPWIDYPLEIKRLFGEEGLFGTGAELSWLVPNPWHQYLTLTYEVFNNDNDALFAGEKSDDFTHLVHIKSFRDLSPTSTLELGASLATAPNNGAHGGRRSTVEGVDITYRWKPKEAGLYRSFLWQTEFFFAQADRQYFETEDSFGMYTAGEYQFARRWKFGLRFDSAQMPYEVKDRERAYSAYLTFLETEFVFWRLGYQFTDRNFREEGNKDEHQVFLQLNWTLGVHPAHKY
jgi:hypothetical protein